MTNSQWPMTGDRGAACRLRSPDRTMPLRFQGPTLASPAGNDIRHWALGIHWLLGIGHCPLVMHDTLPTALVRGPDLQDLAGRVPSRGDTLHAMSNAFMLTRGRSRTIPRLLCRRRGFRATQGSSTVFIVTSWSRNGGGLLPFEVPPSG